ncbi:hypothetical protein [Mesorhizobium sp.]|uniref:hypothetical protein n=2 Tax=Mesorhizobium TaxID=68287 RepID=UPI000FE5553E|nr:hypothetical protein [Mesorhizobium sp.]RWG04444.1 MAG: hypothetical protein EOQ54_13645 [Mesorhizobium sp.]RWG97962.1 MAG: hypothetical protein EOQ72_17680 [Mesorhizobium sp.]TIN45174.1 MAG: hypothetical protein E5Y25_11695 [Mesorhizobium sp.]TIR93607.1 MAG: hypothetical protein E5X08_09175 [Mesorhizobium sp.]TIS03951.1 MAG: hypothetical protein E5X13_03655 [Mesorhizobium sp.]
MALTSDSQSQEAVVQRLVREIGITEAQALELVSFLGLNWGSLVREAKALSFRKWPVDEPDPVFLHACQGTRWKVRKDTLAIA